MILRMPLVIQFGVDLGQSIISIFLLVIIIIIILNVYTTFGELIKWKINIFANIKVKYFV